MSLSAANLHTGVGRMGVGSGAVGRRWLGMRLNRDLPPHILSGLLDQAMVDRLCLDLVTAADSEHQRIQSNGICADGSSNIFSSGGSSVKSQMTTDRYDEGSPPRKRARKQQPVLQGTGPSGDGAFEGVASEKTRDKLSPTTGALMCSETVDSLTADSATIATGKRELEDELVYRRQEKGEFCIM